MQVAVFRREVTAFPLRKEWVGGSKPNEDSILRDGAAAANGLTGQSELIRSSERAPLLVCGNMRARALGAWMLWLLVGGVGVLFLHELGCQN